MLVEKNSSESSRSIAFLRRRGVCDRGFSLIELVIIIAAVGVLSSLILSATCSSPATVAAAKFESDVITLNQLVGIYLAGGGKFEGNPSAQDVLDSLKRSRPSSGMQQYNGVASGRLVDVRLRARMGSGSLKSGSKGRAVWDVSRKRFNLEDDGSSGVDEFYLDEALAAMDYGTSARSAQTLSFNKSNGWVWGGAASVADAAARQPTYIDPVGEQTYFRPEESVGPTSGSGSGGGGSGGGLPGGSTGGGGSSSGGGSGVPQLPKPVIAPSGGTFAYAGFPSSITISSNGAPVGQSKLVFQLNNGAWEDYAGSFSVQSGDTVEAENVTLNAAAYTGSLIASASFYRLVADIGGSEAGSWTGVTGGGNLVQSITTDGQTISLTHGSTRLDLGGGQYLDAGVQNVISFTQTGFAGVTPDTWFKLGDVTILNGTTYNDSEASGATLKLDFNLSSPAAASTVDINLGFISRENTSDRLASADIVEFKNPATGTVFESGGVSYRLELSWISLDPGASAVQDSQLLIYEGATAHAELSARFVPDR